MFQNINYKNDFVSQNWKKKLDGVGRRPSPKIVCRGSSFIEIDARSM